jgi:tetratricopeptide (TPR) repeat protein
VIEPDKPEETRNLTAPPRLPEPETVAREATAEKAVGAAVPRGADAWRLPPRYQPQGAIARGGMGLVLRVHDVEVDRPLALKLLLDHDAATTERARRFLEEARITGQLQHPGIPPVHEIGRLTDGRPFFSMKLIAGRTLAELLQERSSPQTDLPRFVPIFEQIAQTVAYAHSQGVIHRDLKPLNIMVGAFGEVQVMDWGLAKRLRDSTPETGPAVTDAAASAPAPPRAGGATVDYTPAASEGRTQAGQVMGTFAYMPPEQARGEVHRLDKRSDVFGLGAILCQILTGEPPYRSTAGADLWRQAREGDLTDALSRLDCCGAEAELIALAKSYLAAEPGERPAHAGAVAEQITAHLQSVQQRLQQAERAKAVAGAKAVEERKRRRWQLALAASVLLLMLGGSAAGVWYYQDQANRATEEARQQTAVAARQQQLDHDVIAALDEAQRTHDKLYGQLADEQAVQALLSDIDSWQTRVQAERSAWQQAERLAAVDPALLAPPVAERLREAGQQVETDETDWHFAKKLDAIRLGEVAVVDDFFRDEAIAAELTSFFQEELKLDVSKQDPATVAQAIRQSRLRHVLVAVLDYWAGIAAKDQARLLTVARQADPEPWRDRLRDPRTWDDRAMLEQLAREVDVAQQTPQILLLLAQRLRHRGGDDRTLLQLTLAVYPRDFWVYISLARNTKERTEKLGYLQAALAVRPQSFVIHEYIAGVLNNRREDLAASIRHRRMALKINPRYARAHLNLGSALLYKGDLDGAIRHSQTAMDLDPKFAYLAHITIGEALFKKHDREGALHHYRIAQPNAADPSALVMLANALRDIGERDEAIAAYRKVIRINPNDALAARAYCDMGVALSRQKKMDEAIAAYREAIRINPKDASSYYAYANLGLALSSLEKRDEAIAAYRKALEFSPNDAAIYYNLGLVLFRHKKLDEAIAVYRRAIEIDARFASAYSNLGLALANKGELDEAIAAYRQAIRIEPGNARTHYNLGHALQNQKNLDQAIASYREAIQLDARFASAYKNLGAALAKKGELSEAVTAYRLAIELRPNDDGAYNNLGMALHKRKRFQEASAAFGKAIALAPKEARPALRYAAACDAVLAGCGQGEEAATLDDAKRSQLRRQARDWLQDNLRLYRQQFQTGNRQAARMTAAGLSQWQQDTDLALMREPAELAKLSEDERQTWQVFWSDVKELAEQAQARGKNKEP